MILSVCVLYAIESLSVSRIAGGDCVCRLHDAVRAPEGEEVILSSATTEWTDKLRLDKNRKKQSGYGINATESRTCNYNRYAQCSRQAHAQCHDLRYSLIEYKYAEKI